MKKTLTTIITIIFFILNLGGCSSPQKAYNKSETDSQYVEKQATEIIRCFNQKDVEGLKKLFCSNSQEYYDLDSEIQVAFEFYEGTSKSYILSNSSYAGGSMENGEWYDKHFRPKIKKIKTDVGKQYTIGYSTYSIYKYDAGEVGIGVLALYDEDDNLLAVIGGYDW
ncbi:MAG: DUF5104 domain-containing protein [Oscillospiraceae bacterium]|nr:DUF5104 domain-containing protein [Oscillospiraceae bacterium]